MSERPARSRLPLRVAALSALLWGGAHLLVHGRRGWPMEVPGEWDLLLTSVAIAGGAAPDAAIGTLHGNELGSYLVAALVAVPTALGADPVAAAKWIALAFGAASVACVAGFVAWVLEREGPEGERVSGTAGLVTGALLATLWPGLHFELAGLNGRTPEALLPQLAAVLLVVTAAPGGRMPWRALAVGALLSLGVLLSPVALWTCAACAGVALLRVERRGWATMIAGGALGAALPLLGFGLLVPGGWEGLRLFAVEQSGGLGVSAEGSGAPLGLGLLGKVGRALEGGAHNPELRARPLLLGALGWASVLSLAWMAVRLRRDRGDPSGLAALVGLSWLVPLVLLPTDKWFYPLAYRYWLVLLALGAGALVISLARRAPRGLVAVAVAAGLAAAWLPRSFVAPAPSRAEALVASGAHRLNARPGRDRNAAFTDLFPTLARADRPALAEGYGLALGGDYAVDLRDAAVTGGAVARPWEVLELDGGARTAFLVGLGCGATAVGAVPPGLVESMARAPAPQAEAMLWGLGRCHEDAERQPAPSLPPGALDGVQGRAKEAFDAGAARRPWEGVVGGIASTVAEPAQWMPPRW